MPFLLLPTPVLGVSPLLRRQHLEFLTSAAAAAAAAVKVAKLIFLQSHNKANVKKKAHVPRPSCPSASLRCPVKRSRRGGGVRGKAVLIFHSTPSTNALARTHSTRGRADKELDLVLVPVPVPVLALQGINLKKSHQSQNQRSNKTARKQEKEKKKKQ